MNHILKAPLKVRLDKKEMEKYRFNALLNLTVGEYYKGCEEKMEQINEYYEYSKSTFSTRPIWVLSEAKDQIKHPKKEFYELLFYPFSHNTSSTKYFNMSLDKYIATLNLKFRKPSRYIYLFEMRILKNKDLNITVLIQNLLDEFRVGLHLSLYIELATILFSKLKEYIEYDPSEDIDDMDDCLFDDEEELPFD